MSLNLCRAGIVRTPVSREAMRDGGGVTISIRTIAQVAATSVSSVSRVLNNSGYVSPDVRQRVEAAIKDLNYAPSKGGAHAAGGSQPNDRADAAFGRCAILRYSRRHDREGVFERGYQTLICSSAENEDTKRVMSPCSGRKGLKV